ncbi:hypothetical protein UlMin_029669 [Ulmus minor]
MRLLLHLLFFFLQLPFFLVLAQTNGTVRVGDPLIAGNTNSLWLSPSQDFAFGFHQPQNDNRLLLAIWYNKIQETTIVWYANYSESNLAPRQSKLELTRDKGLLLTNPQGEELWSSNLLTNSTRVGYASMNNTGNFVIIDENSRSPIWESFKHPRDTLLPTQIMEINSELSSQQRPTNFSRGKFQFRMQADGIAVLNAINLPSGYVYKAYYWSGTRDGENGSKSGYKVVFDVSGYLYLLRRSGEKYNMTSPKDVEAYPASNYYHKMTLNFDGVLTLNVHPKSASANASWMIRKVVPDNICLSVGDFGGAPCGYNSICSLKEDGTPSCKCPIGYSPFNLSDEYSGCKPDFLQFCDSSGDRSFNGDVELLPLQRTDWPTSDYEVFKPYNIEDCKSSCLLDCLCAAVVYDSDDQVCLKKKLPLSNGREDGKPSTTAFLKLSKSTSKSLNDPPILVKKKQSNTLIIIVSILLGGSVFVNIILAGAIGLGFSFFYQKKLAGKSPHETSVKSNLRHFTYKELMEATNEFKEELGRGSCLVAVKVLDRVFQDNEKEFKAEVNVIGQTHHKNLVRLIGYCDEKQHRLLVYEFMQNGTLASFLFDGLKPSWHQRTQIAFGIARGLFYLHEGCSTHIIHCDIKPQNVLLDEYYNARISDFGLAKLLVINQSQTKTAIRGTKGYVAPDWFRSAPISVKVDVYSFGVLLLEIFCCRKNVEVSENGGDKDILTDWSSDCYRYGKLDVLVENDMEAMGEIKMVERFVMVALWCLQEDPSSRPTMKKVMLMLEGLVQVSAPPIPCSSSYIT